MRNSSLSILLVFFCLPISLFAQSDVWLSVESQNGPELEMGNRPFGSWPEIIGSVDNHLLIMIVEATHFFEPKRKIIKRSLSTGEELFRAEIETEWFRGRKIIYEDFLVSEGDVHLIYRTERVRNDSLYLISVRVDSSGTIHPPRVLLASYLESKWGNDNIELAWTDDKSSLSILAVTKDWEFGKTIFTRRVFNSRLEPVETVAYLINFEFNKISTSSSLFTFNNHYVLVNSYGEDTASYIVEVGSNRARLREVRAKYDNSFNANLFESDGQIYLCHLVFEDNRSNSVTRYCASTVDMDFGQTWVTDFNIEDSSVGEYLPYKYGYCSIKSILDHPDGGYIVTLHHNKKAEYYTYDRDYLVMSIGPTGSIHWVNYIPANLRYANHDGGQNFSSFSSSGDYITFTSTEPGQASMWSQGDLDSRAYGNEVIVATNISDDGEIEFRDAYVTEEAPIEPFLKNLWPIVSDGERHEFYSFQETSRRGFSLVKLTIYGLPSDYQVPRFIRHRYGFQYR